VRVLITGGRGQLGRAVSAALSADEAIPLGHAELDITNEAAVAAALAEHRPEVVIHAAAWTDTAGCEGDVERAMLVNGSAAGFVARASAASGARMVYISSNEVFDGEAGQPYVEGDSPNPINGYARSKLEGERQVAEASPDHVIVRTAWLYGPGRVSFPEKIIQGARERGSLKVVTDEVASPTWTVDLAEAVARLIRSEPSGVYHLTNAGECSRLEWAREVLAESGLGDVPVEPATQADFGAPYRKPVYTTLANTRAKALGVTLRPWREALVEHLSPKYSGAAQDVAASNR
jgi:dTDP-4-dehydrorhamnose reductase